MSEAMKRCLSVFATHVHPRGVRVARRVPERPQRVAGEVPSPRRGAAVEEGGHAALVDSCAKHAGGGGEEHHEHNERCVVVVPLRRGRR